MNTFTLLRNYTPLNIQAFLPCSMQMPFLNMPIFNFSFSNYPSFTYFNTNQNPNSFLQQMPVFTFNNLFEQIQKMNSSYNQMNGIFEQYTKLTSDLFNPFTFYNDTHNVTTADYFYKNNKTKNVLTEKKEISTPTCPGGVCSAPKTNTQRISTLRNPYTSHKYANIKVTTKYNGTTSDLDKYLNDKGVLKGKGKKFIELQEKYGINAAFLAAIACNESGNGTSNLAIKNNNIMGITKPGGHGFRSFSSVEECLDYSAGMLKRNYINQNLTTISQIHQKYCPIGANNDPNSLNKGWGKAVGKYMSEIMV